MRLWKRTKEPDPMRTLVDEAFADADQWLEFARKLWKRLYMTSYEPVTQEELDVLAQEFRTRIQRWNKS